MSGIGNTDSDAAFDRAMAKLHEENATHNSKMALEVAQMTKEEMATLMLRMDATVNMLTQKVMHLEQKYNLLLSKHFNNGPTVD